jgi:cytochrome b561
MALGNTRDSYGCVARGIHWLTVAFIIAGFTLAWTDVIGIHKYVGVTILTLGLIRIVWTIVQPTVAPLDGPRLQQIAAKAVHGLLMLWLVAMPLTGWTMSSAAGRPVSFWGWFTLPPLVAPDRAFAHTMAEIHETLALVGLALIAVHVAAAIWHHVVVKDDTLRRMLPCACFGRKADKAGCETPGCGCGR